MNSTPDHCDGDLLDLFFESAEEILQSMNEAGLALEDHPEEKEYLRQVRRAVHTLKGDSAACGFRDLSELAHSLEDVLTPEVTQENADLVAGVVLAATDTFSEMLAAYHGHLPLPDGTAVREQIRQLLRPDAPGKITTSRATFQWTEQERCAISEAFRRNETVYNIALDLEKEMPVPAAAFSLAKRALESAGTILALRPDSGVFADDARTIKVALSSARTPDWIRQHCRVPAVVEKLSVEAVSMFPSTGRDIPGTLVEPEAAADASRPFAQAVGELPTDFREARSPAGSGTPSAAENLLRVEVTRIDAVMNLVGELIIGKSMLQRAITEFERRNVSSKDPLRVKLADALAFQSRVLGELQKSVMKIRMVPVEQLFRRFPRIVRDVARLRNKDVGISLAGQNTDLDKSILDVLAEPLSHLVRNAADHGIETAAERELAGKPARGTIRLNACHDGDHVMIEVSDDGRGLDCDKILRRAIEHGILTTEQAARLNASEVLELVFAPGLSTADEVTEVSGRGVGLDVVKSVIEGLKGTVKIESEAGKGTTFRLLVPFTMASIQALLFRVHGRLYAVPLSSVIEITRITDQDIHQLDEQEVFPLRKQVLPLIRLDQLGPHPVRNGSRRTFVLVIASGTRRFGLAVDGLAGEEELVVKALEDQLVASPLVSGASILGDGTVVLILNVPVVISHFMNHAVLGATA